MFSEIPSDAAREPIQDATPIWSLYVFRVAGRRAQQRILRALLELGRHGVTGLGTHRGSDYFVIVDYSSDADKAHAKRVVRDVDPGAAVTFSGRKRQIARNA